MRGQIDQAIKAAEALDDPEQQVFGLVTVAGVLADRSRETGNVDDPLVIAGTAIDRRELAAGAIRAAERAVSVTAASKLKHTVAQTTRVEVLGKTGRLDQARQALDAIGDADQRQQARGDLVRWMAEGGEPASALKLAREIADPEARCEALSDLLDSVAKRQARTQNPPPPIEVIDAAASELLASAKEIAALPERSEAQQHASAALALAGRKSDALRAAKAAFDSALEVHEHEVRELAIARSAEAWARADPGPESAKTALHALREVAPTGNPYWDESALRGAAQALIQASDAEKAVDATAKFDDPKARALALAALADILGGFAWDGQVVPARRAAKGALHAAAQVADPDARASTVATLMRIAGRADLVDEALGAIRSIPQSQAIPRTQALSELAQLVAEHHRYDQARELARDCGPGERLSVFAAILDASSRPNTHRFGRGDSPR